MRALLVLLALLLVATRASAEPVPVIEGGREQEILALFRPYELGKEVTSDWKLWDVTVSPVAIRVECRGPGDRRAAIRLIHPDTGDGAPTKSFVIQRDPGADPAGFSALDALTQAVTENDHGNFFRRVGVPRVAVAPNHLRFVAIPVATLALGLVGMWLTRRFRARRA